MRGDVLPVGLADRVTAVAQVDRPSDPTRGSIVSGRPSLADGLPKTAIAATKSGVLGGSGLLNPIAGIGHRGDDVHHGRALRVAAEHQSRVGAGAHHVLDVGAGVVGAAGGGEEVVVGRIVHRVGADRTATDLAAQRVDECPADGSEAGASSVPRANTTSMSGQSADATGANAIDGVTAAAARDEQPRQLSVINYAHVFATPFRLRSWPPVEPCASS